MTNTAPWSIPTERFFAFGDWWQQWLGWLEHAGRLPVDRAGFEARYGSFHSAADIETFVAAIAEVQELAGDVGGLLSLRRAIQIDPETVGSAEPPPAIYARVVWLAARTGNVADTFASTLSNLPLVLGGPSVDEYSRAAAVKIILAGEGGLSPEAASLREAFADARAQLAPRIDRLRRVNHLLAGTALLNEANVVIGRFGSHEQHGDTPRKRRLIEDTHGFFTGAASVATAALGIDNELRRIEAWLETTSNRLIQFCTISSTAQLADLAWVQNALGISATIDVWHALAEDARAFVQASLIH